LNQGSALCSSAFRLGVIEESQDERFRGFFNFRAGDECGRWLRLGFARAALPKIDFHGANRGKIETAP